MEQWIKQGKKEGLEQGWERGLEQSVLCVLRQRFAETPAEIEERIRALPTRSLEQTLDEAVAAPDLEAFARWLTAVETE